MSKTKKEVTCIVGSYTNADGQQKNRYQRIGSIIQTNKGEMLKLDVIPLKDGGWDGWAFLNEPRPREDKYQGLPKENDDDIPF